MANANGKRMTQQEVDRAIGELDKDEADRICQEFSVMEKLAKERGRRLV